MFFKWLWKKKIKRRIIFLDILLKISMENSAEFRFQCPTNKDLSERTCPYVSASRNPDCLVFAEKVCQPRIIQSQMVEGKGTVPAGCFKPGQLKGHQHILKAGESMDSGPWGRLRALRGAGGTAGPHEHALFTQRILEDKEDNPLPAALVQPHTGKLCWFLDEAAARLLTVPFEKHSTL